jgi:hypothetical protein
MMSAAILILATFAFGYFAGELLVAHSVRRISPSKGERNGR